MPGNPLMKHDSVTVPSRIYVIGDRRALDEVVALADPLARPRHFADVEAFLAAAPHLPRGGVILASANDPGPLADLPGIVGHNAAAFVLVSLARQDVAQAVTAVRMGARGVIARPCGLDHLRQAIADARQGAARPSSPTGLAALGTLSAREREVFDGIVGGMTNKQIGARLGISYRTVEIHRGRMMRKLGVTRLSDVLEIGFALRTQTQEESPGYRPSVGELSDTAMAMPDP